MITRKAKAHAGKRNTVTKANKARNNSNDTKGPKRKSVDPKYTKTKGEKKQKSTKTKGVKNPKCPNTKGVKNPKCSNTKGVTNNLCVPLTVGDEDNDEHDMDPKSQKMKGKNNPCGPVTVGHVDNDEHPIIISNQLLGTFDLNKFDVDVLTISKECDYVHAIDQVSKLHVLKPQHVKRSYNEKKELGLFHLFLTNTFITQNIRQWTNSKLKGKAIKNLERRSVWQW